MDAEMDQRKGREPYAPSVIIVKDPFPLLQLSTHTARQRSKRGTAKADQSRLVILANNNGVIQNMLLWIIGASVAQGVGTRLVN